MNTDTKTILWAEFGVIVLSLGVVHNYILNGTWDSLSIEFTRFSAFLFIVKYFLKVEGGWVY